MRSILRVLAPAATLLLPAARADAQDVTETELAKPDAIIKDGIKAVLGAMRLADGRLLFLEQGTGIMRADFAGAKVDRLLTSGPEDTQYRSAGLPMRWSGDSIAMADNAKGRLMILAPDGTLARTIRIGEPIGFATAPAAGGGGGGGGAAAAAPADQTPRGPRLPTLRYAQGTTHLLGTGFPPRAQAPNPTVAPPRVAFPIVRFSLASLAYDTVAQLLPAQAPRQPQRDAETATLTVTLPTSVVQPIDTWAAYADGTVAIVRAALYRVDFIAPDGTKSQGAPIPTPKLAVTDEDKKLILAEYKRVYDETMMRSPMRTQVKVLNYTEPSSWPTTHPPFRAEAGVVVGSDARLWLQTRCVKDEKSTCYDVIDRTGARAARYRVPAKTRVIAATSDAVITVNEQKDDKPVLQRHPLK